MCACLGVGVDLSEKQRLVGWFSAGNRLKQCVVYFCSVFCIFLVKKRLVYAIWAPGLGGHQGWWISAPGIAGCSVL